ncbi:glutamate receptor ionotropic, kainate glr-3-like [Bacillus rossius redtenbacheri]|uniref:glutamate receptor ionotropic, kainate glr-3-like n=1 Tax=Bacillus rossius redtenbacheri TaxID=93214 RepID=UPI002FDD45B1
MDERFVDSWGYKGADGKFTGLVGLLQRGQVDVGGVVSVMTTERLDVIDFTTDTTAFRARFFFRQPSLSSVANIYVMPFSIEVWATHFFVVVALTAVMFMMQWVKWRPAGTEPYSRDWSEIFLSSLGTTCQQGWQKTPQDIPARILFICLNILSIFFFTSYSAIVVSLLQTPSSSINNLEELINSPMKIAMHDIIYNHNIDNYMNVSASAVVRRLFAERVSGRPARETYLPLDEGMELVRRGQFAFHVDVGAYKQVKDTWREAEKCDLAELYMLPPCVTSVVPVRKGSPYKKLITVKMRRVREVGLLAREKARWGTDKQRCQDRGAVFVSVGLQDFRPALLVLAYGMLLSAAILLLECAHHRWSRDTHAPHRPRCRAEVPPVLLIDTPPRK